MATHGRAELAWICEVGGCEAPARPAGQKKRDRKTTERGPRALTGVALHSSWGLTADLDLGIVLPLTPSEPHALTLKSCTRPDTGTRPARYSSFSLVNLWSTLHRSQHCLEIQTSTLSKHRRRFPSCILLQTLVITRWTAAEPLEDTGSRQTTFYEQEVAKLFLSYQKASIQQKLPEFKPRSRAVVPFSMKVWAKLQTHSKPKPCRE